MNVRRLGVAWVAIIAVTVAAAPVAGEETTIKNLMGENFAGLHTILVSLITSNYTNVPAQAEIIQDHASELTSMMPESARANRDQFLAYAYSLKSHAKDLQSISELLIEHDQKKAPGGELASDQLREALAAHYGGMVTTCVACHNRYRNRAISIVK